MQQLETMLRNQDHWPPRRKPKAVRRRLIDFYGKGAMSTTTPPLSTISTCCIESDPNNVDLQVLRATYLAKSGNIDDATKYSYKLIGYDPKKDAFDVKKATAPHATEVYFTLAGLLRTKASNPDVGRESREPNGRGQPERCRRPMSIADDCLPRWGDADGSKADAQKAYQLKPEDTDVLLLVTDMAAQDKKLRQGTRVSGRC